ncbi:MAG: energy transducer TonB [Bacteroidota bacterium]
MKYLFLACFFLPTVLIAQLDKNQLADSLSSMAMKASMEKKYSKADTILSEAIKIVDRKELRSQWGMVKINLADSCGGCQEFKKAIEMGNKNTMAVFNTYCTQLDSLTVGEKHPLNDFADHQTIRKENCSDELMQVFYQTTKNGKEVKFTVDDKIQKSTEEINEDWKGKVAHRDLIYSTVDQLPIDKEKKTYFSNLSIMQHLMLNMSYPEAAKEDDIHGEVEVSFIIGLDGTIEDITIVQSLHPVLDKEAMRLIGILPELQAAEVNGKPVRMLYTMPIRF